MKASYALLITGVGFGLLIAVWNEARGRHRAEAALAANQAQHAALRRQLAAENERLARAEATRTGTQPALEAPPAARKPLAPDAAAAISRLPWRDIVIERNPALQARLLTVRKAELGFAYGPLFTTENLAPDQREKLAVAMAAAAGRTMDLKAAARVRELPESDPAIRTLREQSEATLRAEEREILGFDGFTRLLDYERAQPMRDTVALLAAALVFAGEPLTGTQANELTRILAEGTAGYRSGGKADRLIPNLGESGEAERLPIDEPAVLARAREIVSPVQLARLEAEIGRGRTIIDLFNIIRQTPGDPIIGFMILGRK